MHITEQFPSYCRPQEADTLTWLDVSGKMSCLVAPGLELVVEQWLSETPKDTVPKSTARMFYTELGELVELLQQRLDRGDQPPVAAGGDIRLAVLAAGGANRRRRAPAQDECHRDVVRRRVQWTHA